MSRPFYVIAHNPNTFAEVEQALSDGANALEPDLIHLSDNAIDGNGNKIKTGPSGIVVYHDDVLITTRVPHTLEEYLTKIKTLADDKDPKLALIAFDCKSPAATAEYGGKILNAIREHLKGTNLKVIINVGSLDDKAIFDNILTGDYTLNENEGVMVDGENDVKAVIDFFKGRRANGHICYGNGTKGPGPNLKKTIKDATEMRKVLGYPNFTYVYTINLTSSMKDFIELGVDGIISDHVKDLADVVNNSEHVHLATRDDNPFADHAETAYGLEVKTADKTYAGTNANITFTLTGEAGATSTIVDAGAESKMFEQGRIDFVTLPDASIGNLKSITVSIDDSGSGPDWYLEYIKVFGEKLLGFQEKTALFNQEIKPGGPVTKNFATGTYLLEVKTRDASTAGTSSLITFTLTGTNGSTSVTVDAAGDGFERGSIDNVPMPSENLGSLRYITVSKDNAGPNPDWMLDYIKITSSEFLGYAEKTANFGVEIKAGENVSRDILGTYNLNVKTKDKSLAGTDANIQFNLYGTKGWAGVKVSGAGALFERNTSSPVPLPSPDLGLLKAIEVSMDNAGNNPDWTPEYIHITSTEWLWPKEKRAFFGYEIKGDTTAKAQLHRTEVEITWPNPQAISYGTPLSDVQLNANALDVDSKSTVNGKYVYKPIIGEKLLPGIHALHVSFTPDDYSPSGFAGHETAEKTVSIRVLKATPEIHPVGGTFTFDENPHAGSGSATGGKGESLPVEPLVYTGHVDTTDPKTPYGPTETPPTDTGTYTVTVSTPGDANNNPGSATADLIIQPGKAKVLAIEALRVRQGPSIKATIIDWLKHDQVVDVFSTALDEDGNQWAQIGIDRWSSIHYKKKTWMQFPATEATSITNKE